MRYTTLEEAMVGSSSSTHAPQQYTSLAILQKGGENRFQKEEFGRAFFAAEPVFVKLLRSR